ncbi:hypothetical protein Tsubulata_006740 [Turnera subulata]|uniref:MATH domain-containing protein n=1 Tax=Turnera subulata TaxID=218843 RepID=A0A9Q0GHU8_9ROSI|nr:hypothetical protein Tsubulata_006740 [Turnera subulata]
MCLHELSLGRGREEEFVIMEASDDTIQTTRQLFRKVPPAHYTFEIKDFTSLVEAKIGNYETNNFEIGGYNWKLVLYPNGVEKGGDGTGSDHVSLFLAVAKPEDISVGWEVNAYVNFFVFDQLRDRFLLIQDANGTLWRFHKMKSEWGFTDFLPHNVLNDPSSGYIVDNRCIFGVEVFISKNSLKGESILMVKEPKNGSYLWKIDNYSTLVSSKSVTSNTFSVENRKWKIELYPKGDSRSMGTHLSVFLTYVGPHPIPPKQRLMPKATLRIRDQVDDNHFEMTVGTNWFDTSAKSWGHSNFMSLSTLTDSSKGYLVTDSLIVEVIVHHMFFVNDFS